MKLEPWDYVFCSECKEMYHLIDGPKCECGQDEWDKKFKENLGDKNGFIKTERTI